MGTEVFGYVDDEVYLFVAYHVVGLGLGVVAWPKDLLAVYSVVEEVAVCAWCGIEGVA